MKKLLALSISLLLTDMSWGAIAFVSRANTATAVTATSVSSPSRSHTAGNLLVAVVQHQGPTINSVTNTAGDTFTKSASSAFANSGAINYQSIWYTASTNGHASDIVTANFAASYVFCTIAVYEFSGTNTSSPYIQDATGTDVSDTIQSGMVTLTGPSVIVGILESDSGEGPIPGGYTGSNTDGFGYIYDFYRITSTSQMAEATTTAAYPWGIIVAAFSEATASSARACPPPYCGIIQ